MQAVILAGGLGTRLRPITETVPKPMVPVAGVPYLEHQLRELARQEIRDILLLTGYLGEQIEAYFGSGEQLGLRLLYSREPEPLGTGGALWLALPLLEDDFLVIYGDSYLPIEYQPVLEKLRASAAEGVVVVYDNRLSDTSVKNNINLDPAGHVIRYEKDGDGLSYVDSGVLALRRDILSVLQSPGSFSLEKEMFPKLIARRSLFGYPTGQRFYDIGTLERLQTIESLFTAHDHH